MPCWSSGVNFIKETCLESCGNTATAALADRKTCSCETCSCGITALATVWGRCNRNPYFLRSTVLRPIHTSTFPRSLKHMVPHHQLPLVPHHSFHSILSRNAKETVIESNSLDHVPAGRWTPRGGGRIKWLNFSWRAHFGVINHCDVKPTALNTSLKESKLQLAS